MALIAVVILTMVIVTAASETRVVLRTQLHRIEQSRAERTAHSGVLYALAQMTEIDTSNVTLDDDWAVIGDSGAQEVTVGRGYFRIEVLDASGRLNLNTATQEQLELLPLTTEQIDAILDWKEPDLQPRLEGAKDEYYEALTNPYLAKLRNFDTVNELLMVKGFAPSLLFEPQEQVIGTSLVSAGATDDQIVLADVLTVDSRSSNVSDLGEPKLNVNTASENQMIVAGLTEDLADAITDWRNDNGTFASWAQILQVPGVTLQNVNLLLDYLTLDTADVAFGKININTASEQTLNLMPGMTPDVAQSLVSSQGTFASLGDVSGVSGMSLELLGQIAGMITLSSESFLVRVVGVFGTTSFALEAIVTIEETGPRVMKVERYPFIDAVARWGWEPEPTTQTVLVEGTR
jgi:general secretion pathway protein K